ncbi:hypothetical protein C5167_048121 [Papaver somniferum]|uniref:Uncharacterized protein n=1 Tax=Papaver somniferum TaxID=3469 RepID=A0A4Y7KKC4_PAPSO|nr:hypothetical protein C5167_048121 [Papaver somniferum]
MDQQALLTYDFVDPIHFFRCREKVVVNGTLYGSPCANPTKHIRWDGTHYSDAAHKWVAKVHSKWFYVRVRPSDSNQSSLPYLMMYNQYMLNWDHRLH